MMDLSLTLTLSAQRRAIEQARERDQRLIATTQERQKREDFDARQAAQRDRQRRELDNRQQEQRRQSQWRQLEARQAMQREQERSRAMDRQRREAFERQQQQQQQRQLADLSNERGAAGRTRSLEDERRHQPADRRAKEGFAVTNELGASTPPKHGMEFKPGVPEEIRQMAEEAQRMEAARKLQEVMARAVASTRPDVQTQRPTIVRKSEGQAQAAPQQAQKNDQRPTIVRKGQSPSQTAPSNTERPQIVRKGQPAPAATPAQSVPAQKPRDAPSMQPRAR